MRKEYGEHGYGICRHDRLGFQNYEVLPILNREECRRLGQISRILSGWGGGIEIVRHQASHVQLTCV